VVWLAPRVLKISVRPRRLSGVIVRPLSFTVRRRCGCHCIHSRPREDVRRDCSCRSRRRFSFESNRLEVLEYVWRWLRDADRR
jgi:hypothetical protein